MLINDFNKFCIYSVREKWVIFKFRTDFLNFKMIHIFHKYNSVGISHGNTCKMISVFLYFYRHINGFIPFCQNRDFFWGENGRTHIYTDGGNLPVFYGKIKIFDTAFCCNGNACFIYNAVVVGVFCNAADSVSAHSSLRAVKIIHIHFAVCDFRRFNKNQTVGTDPKVAVAYKFCHLTWIFYGFLKTVYIYIVVSNSLHFCEFHNIISFRDVFIYRCQGQKVPGFFSESLLSVQLKFRNWLWGFPDLLHRQSCISFLFH